MKLSGSKEWWSKTLTSMMSKKEEDSFPNNNLKNKSSRPTCTVVETGNVDSQSQRSTSTSVSPHTQDTGGSAFSTLSAMDTEDEAQGQGSGGGAATAGSASGGNGFVFQESILESLPDSMSYHEKLNLVNKAVSTNDKYLLKATLDKYPEDLTNIFDPVLSGRSVLHEACKVGYLEIVLLLLNYGADKFINTETKEGTPLKLACEFGHTEIVDSLINHGVLCPDPEISSSSPLYLAVKNGHSGVISCFTRYRNGELIFGHYNISVLFYGACHYGHEELVNYFIKSSEVSVNMPVQKVPINEVHNADKLTPIYGACKGNHEDIIYLLNEKGAHITPQLLDTFPDLIKNVLQRHIVPFEAEEIPNGLENPLKVKWKRRHLHINEIPLDWLADCLHQIVEIDISRNKLKYLPPWLPWALPNVMKCDVSHNDLLTLGQPKDVICNKLVEFNLSHNSLDAVPISLFQLKSLKVLLLKENLITELPPTRSERASATSTIEAMSDRLSSVFDRSSVGFVDFTLAWTCDNLEQLDVSHNRLKEIPVHIQNAGHLTNLDVSYNRLTHFPASWPCSMENLNVSHNQLEMFVQNVDMFWSQSMRSIRLDHNQLIEISPGICSISTLTYLRLSHNKLNELPPVDHWKCSNLETLDLSCNLLGDQQRFEANLKKRRFRLPGARDVPSTTQYELDLPDMFSEKLRYLFLRGNYLFAVPPTVFKLKRLDCLDLTDNEITVLPNELGKLSATCDLRVDEKAMKNIPREFLRASPAGSTQASRQVLTHLRTKLRHSTPYYRMKLVIVGKEGRGKTTLLSVLQGQKYSDNVSTHGVSIKEWKFNPFRFGKPLSQAGRPTVIFSTWDMAGQRDYYVTHQCFLSPNALYLVVWDLQLHIEGVLNLRPWLLNIQIHLPRRLHYTSIQARAPDSCVIIIGTFLDRLDPDPRKREEKVLQLKKVISDNYLRPGYPKIRGIAEVSCKTMKGIAELKELIYQSAVTLPNIHTPSEKLLGRLVPRSYLELEKLVLQEANRRQQDGEHPVLMEEEFEELVKEIPKEYSDIDTPEERNQAAKFLHETGILLHYSDQHRALNSLYFIDPSWLCDMLAEVINFRNVHDGTLKLNMVKTCLTRADDKRFPEILFQEYIHLLERFDIALQLHEERLLVPSKLADCRPAVTCGTGHLVDAEKKLYRWYKMKYVPSGFWSRLLVRILVGIRQQKHLLSLRSSDFMPQTQMGTRKHLSKQWSLRGSQQTFRLKDDNHVWWRHGIIVHHQEGYFIIESSSALFSDPADHDGILVTVHSSVGDFSAMGFITDHIDGLIMEWFPGLESLTELGDPTISRIIPCPYCIKAQDDPDDYRILLRVSHFPFEDCAVASLENEMSVINCRNHPQPVPLNILVPDLLLSDLPSRLRLDLPQLDLEESEENRLGIGGYAAVYKAKYKGKEVAAKLFHSATRFKDSVRSYTSSTLNFDETLSTEVGSEMTEGRIMSTDIIGKSHTLASMRVSFEEAGIQAIQIFRELRSEVALMAKLRHPCIVTLIAASSKPPCFIMELAPMGNLQTILHEKMKEKGYGDSMMSYKKKNSTRSLVLKKMLTYKLIFQIALAIKYLHKCSIIYRDLKCQNILVWTLDINTAVNIKLSDYGISCFNTPQGIMGNEGTAGYQAPEIKPGIAYDEKVDQFSFAMTTYEIISGHHPFEHYHHPGQITQAVRKGERPSLAALNIDTKFPCLESLMEDCWNSDPESRPSANDIIRTLKPAEFVCQERLLPKLDQGQIDCLYAPLQNTKNQFVWLWGGQGKERVFSILDTDHGVFRANKKRCPGPKPMCTTRVGNTMWVGNKGKEIEVFGYRSTGLPERLWTIPLQSIPLHILYESVNEEKADVQTTLPPQRVYIGQKEGVVSIFCSTDPVPEPEILMRRKKKDVLAAKSVQGIPQASREKEKWALYKTLQIGEGENELSPVTCLEKVAETNEIWAGCGNSVVIISSETLMEQGSKIPLPSSAYVKQLRSFKKRVWCLQQWSYKILEFDAQSRELKYVFNCLETTVNATIAEAQCDPDLSFSQKDIQEGSVTYEDQNMGGKTGDAVPSSALSPVSQGEAPENKDNVLLQNYFKGKKEADSWDQVDLPEAVDTASSASPVEQLTPTSGLKQEHQFAKKVLEKKHGAPSVGKVSKSGEGSSSASQAPGPSDSPGNKRNVLLEKYFKNKSEQEKKPEPLSSAGSNPAESLVKSLVENLDPAIKIMIEKSSGDDLLSIDSIKSSVDDVFTLTRGALNQTKLNELLSAGGPGGVPTIQTLPQLPTQKKKLSRQRGCSEFPIRPRGKYFAKTDMKQIMHQVRSLLVVRDQTLWIGLNSGDIVVVSIDDSELCYNPYSQVLSVLEGKDMEDHTNGRIRHLVAVGTDKVLSTRLFHKPESGPDYTMEHPEDLSDDEDEESEKNYSSFYQVVVWEAYGCEEFYRVQTLWNQLRTAEIDKQSRI